MLLLGVTNKHTYITNSQSIHTKISVKQSGKFSIKFFLIA